MNSEKILSNLLRFNCDIKTNFFTNTEFEDRELEEKYKDNYFKSAKYNILTSNLVIFLGYIATFLYIFYGFYHHIYAINCTVCFSLAVCLIILSNIFKTRKINNIINHAQVFISSANLISKGFILIFIISTPDNDHVEELLRIIIYDFFSTNIYMITILEANLKLSIFYFLLNLSVIILGSIKASENRFYLLEGFTSFCVFVIFYSLRKQWDYKLRLIFAEKNKFQKFYLYTLDYLDGLTGYSINVQNKKMIFYGKKVYSLIENLIANKYLNYENPIAEADQAQGYPDNKFLNRNSTVMPVNGKKPGNHKENNNNNNENHPRNKNNNNENNSDKKIIVDNNLFYNSSSNSPNNCEKLDNLTITFLKKLVFFSNYSADNNQINGLDFPHLEDVIECNLLSSIYLSFYLFILIYIYF